MSACVSATIGARLFWKEGIFNRHTPLEAVGGIFGGFPNIEMLATEKEKLDQYRLFFFERYREMVGHNYRNRIQVLGRLNSKV